MKPQSARRIMLGITKSNFGGAQRYVYDLATELRNMGHEVSVVCGGNGPLINKLQQQSIRVISSPSLGRDVSLLADWKSFIFLLHTLREDKPQIFHINSSKMGGLGGLAARLAGTPRIVFTAHAWAFNESRPAYQKIIIKCLTWVTILLSHTTICVSEQTKNDVVKWPLVASRLRVIHNGVAGFQGLPRSEARERLVRGVSEETLLVGTIAELHFTKGLDVLLEAWAKFKEEHSGELVLIGDGEEKENLEKLARSLGVHESVHFKGFIDEARVLLSGLDIFVLPSRSEALPYAPIEAGLVGLPVIAARVGGIPEIIQDEVSGILVPKESEGPLFSALAYVGKDQELRRKLGENLKRTVQETFTLQKMAHATLEAYE